MGIDPGLNNTGWGVLKYSSSSYAYIDSGIIETSVKNSLFNRIKIIHDQLNSVIDKYSPEIISLEKIFVNNNMKSSLNFAYARGSIMLTLAMRNINIEEIAPNLIKKRITGNGHASKQQVAYMVQSILNIKLDEKKFDVYDALAIALAAEINQNLR